MRSVGNRARWEFLCKSSECSPAIFRSSSRPPTSKHLAAGNWGAREGVERTTPFLCRLRDQPPTSAAPTCNRLHASLLYKPNTFQKMKANNAQRYASVETPSASSGLNPKPQGTSPCFRGVCPFSTRRPERSTSHREAELIDEINRAEWIQYVLVCRMNII